jgi:hypothetical protein
MRWSGAAAAAGRGGHQLAGGAGKRANAGMNEGSLKWYEIPRNQDMLNAIITRAPRELFNQNCDLLTVYAYLKDHKADTLDSVVARWRASPGPRQPGGALPLAAGNAGIEAATNIVVRKGQCADAAVVYLAVIVLAFITFRSWRAVVCAVLPLMLTSVLCEALMVGLNIGVKVATLPVIALGVGIGVDYALYMMTVTLAGLKPGDACPRPTTRPCLHRQGGGADRHHPGHGRGHLGLVAHQVPGRHGHAAGLHVRLEHARRADPAAGAGPLPAASPANHAIT